MMLGTGDGIAEKDRVPALIHSMFIETLCMADTIQVLGFHHEFSMRAETPPEKAKKILPFLMCRIQIYMQCYE